MGELESRLARGGILMVAMKFGVKALGLISTMIVARILTPEDYGIIAIAIGIIGILEVLGEFGFDMALIRDQKATAAHYNTAFTLNFIRGCLFSVGVFFSAGFFASWFSAPHAVDLLRFLALIPLLDAFTNIGVVNFRKEFKFERDLVLTLVSKSIEITVAIVAALVLRNYWALALGIIVGQTANVIIGYHMSSFRPRLELSKWREILGFSGWVFGYNITYALSWRLDALVLARLLPPSAVGYFSNAMSTASIPSSELVMPIARALFPGFSAVAEQPERLKNIYLRSLGATVGVAFPLTFGMAAMADAAVMVLMGPQWRVTADLLAVVALALGTSMLLAGGDPLMIARGRSRALFLRGLVRMIIRPLLILLMVRAYGLQGAAWGLCGAIALDVLLMLYLLRQTVGFTVTQWLVEVHRPVLAVALMVVTLYFATERHTQGFADALGALLLGVPLAAVVYVGSLLALWHVQGRPEGFERSLLDILMKVWRRFRRTGT